MDGPKEDFTAFVEWVLVISDSLFSVPASCTLELREPTTDYGDEPAVMDELKPAIRTESAIAPEPAPQGESSDVDMDYMASEFFFD